MGRDAQPPFATGFPDRHLERPVVPRRHQVDGLPHERAHDDDPPLQGPGQIITPEAFEPGPEAHVHRRRVLGLQASHPFQRPRQWSPDPLEEHLASQQGPVQLPLREDSIGPEGHAASLSIWNTGAGGAVVAYVRPKFCRILKGEMGDAGEDREAGA